MFNHTHETRIEHRQNGNGHVDASHVTIRELAGGDEGLLRELTERDTARMPRGEVVGAERDGRLMAAISLASGEIVADPFHPTADLVALLRVRAGQILPPPA
jgi:hypothetical protein